MATKLRTKMKAAAEEELEHFIDDLLEMAEAYLKECDLSMLGPKDVLRLAAGGRTDTLQSDCLRKIVAYREEALLALYNQQGEMFDKKPRPSDQAIRPSARVS